MEDFSRKIASLPSHIHPRQLMQIAFGQWLLNLNVQLEFDFNPITPHAIHPHSPVELLFFCTLLLKLLSSTSSSVFFLWSLATSLSISSLCGGPPESYKNQPEEWDTTHHNNNG